MRMLKKQFANVDNESFEVELRNINIERERDMKFFCFYLISGYINRAHISLYRAISRAAKIACVLCGETAPKKKKIGWYGYILRFKFKILTMSRPFVLLPYYYTRIYVHLHACARTNTLLCFVCRSGRFSFVFPLLIDYLAMCAVHRSAVRSFGAK